VADDGTPAPIRAALAHLEFVAIHPFNDGNGRTARALSRLMLVRGVTPSTGSCRSTPGSISGGATTSRRSARASASRTSRDMTPPRSPAFFLRAIAGAADHVLARLRGLGQVQIRVRRDVADGRLAPMMLDGLVYAWINRSLRPADYRRVTGRSAYATSRDLATAEKLGYVVGEGASSARWYRLGPKLLETPAAGEPADPRESTPRPAALGAAQG